jgi:hypothetical protein
MRERDGDLEIMMRSKRSRQVKPLGLGFRV